MTTMSDLPIACWLDGPALGRRQAELRGSVLAEAESVEQHCCRFLHFTVTADQGHGSVTVEITGPEGTADFLESWIDVRVA